MTVPALHCFDLDGCLVDSDAAIADALNHALAELGVRTRSAAELRSSIGPPLVENLTRLLAEDGVDVTAGEGPALLARGVTAYRTRYAAVGFDLTAPYPGVVAALEALDAAGGPPRVVVTAKPTTVAAELVARVGLAGRFAAVHGTPGGVAVEEKRVTLAAVLRDRGVDPAAAVMIGDREHDVRAGLACGTATVGVLWGAGTRAELTAAGAAVLVATPPDLPSALTEVPSARDPRRAGDGGTGS